MIADDAPTLVRPLQAGMVLPLAMPLPWLPIAYRKTLVCRCPICGRAGHGKAACVWAIVDPVTGVVS